MFPRVLTKHRNDTNMDNKSKKQRQTLNKKINICHLLTHRGMQSPNVTEIENLDFAPLNFAN